MLLKIAFNLGNSNNSFKTCGKSKSTYINYKVLITFTKLVLSQKLVSNLPNHNNSY